MKRKIVVGSKLVTLLLISVLLLGLPANAQLWGKKKKDTPKSGGGMQMLEGREMGMSKYNFDDTVSKIKAAIEVHQMMVLFTPDHQQMLSMVEMTTPPMVTIEFFHPRYGKVIFQNDGRASLTVPLRIAVMQNEQGKVMFAYDRPSYVLARYNNLRDLGKELDQVLSEIVAEVKAPMSM